MPRIRKTDFTEDELKLIYFLVGQIGGSPDRSLRSIVDGIYEKLEKHFDAEIKDSISYVFRSQIEKGHHVGFYFKTTDCINFSQAVSMLERDEHA